MNFAVQSTKGNTDFAHEAKTSRLFPASIGRFDDPATRLVIDGLAKWVEQF